MSAESAPEGAPEGNVTTDASMSVDPADDIGFDGVMESLDAIDDAESSVAPRKRGAEDDGRPGEEAGKETGDTEEVALVPLEPLQWKDHVILGIGPSHVVAYHEKSEKTVVRMWEETDWADGALVTLDQSPPVDLNDIPIVEVTDKRILRVDPDGFVYLWDVVTGEIMVMTRCLRPAGDVLHAYTPCAATHSDAAIVVAAAVKEGPSVIAVCSWTEGRIFKFFESSVPFISSITGQEAMPQHFWITSAAGIFTLNVSINEPDTWVLAPCTEINRVFVNIPDKDVIRDKIDVSAYLLAVQQFRTGKGPVKKVVEQAKKLKAREYDIIPRVGRPTHICMRAHGIAVITPQFIVFIDHDLANAGAKNKGMFFCRKEAEGTMKACTMIGKSVIACIDNDADLTVIATPTKAHPAPPQSVVPVTAYYDECEMAITEHVPPNSLFQVKGDILAVSCYQGEVYLFKAP